MASIRKRGNSYLLVVSMGYTPDGRRRNPQQKTVRPPAGLTPKQTEKWLQEQAMLFEMSCKKLNPDIDRSITLERTRRTESRSPKRRSRVSTAVCAAFSPTRWRAAIWITTRRGAPTKSQLECGAVSAVRSSGRTSTTPNAASTSAGTQSKRPATRSS